jgi:4-amino-4-deoxy-L-arabinose transferase-like glycosyltransferase
MTRSRHALVGILALAVLLPLIPAGRRVLWESNEARYPVLAQDILEHGRWLVPEIRGQLYLNKPQLYFWTIALVSLPAGRVSELSAALPSVLSALAAVGAVLAIGTRLWGRPAGLLAGLIAATAPPFFVFGHLAIPDMMLTACLTWALYWFLRAASSGWARGPLVGFYVCVALAIGTKGPPGYAALAAAAVAVLGTEGRRGLARLRPALGLLILALAALPWIVPYYVRSHGQFQSDVLVHHYGVWLLRGSLLARVQGVAQTLVHFLPWSIFLVAAAWSWRRAPDAGRRRVALWAGTLWALLVFTGLPRAHYLLPVYPLLALLAAERLARPAENDSPRALHVAAAFASIYALGLALVLIVHPTLLAHGEDVALLPETGWERGVVAVIPGRRRGRDWLLLPAPRLGRRDGGDRALARRHPRPHRHSLSATSRARLRRPPARRGGGQPRGPGRDRVRISGPAARLRLLPRAARRRAGHDRASAPRARPPGARARPDHVARPLAGAERGGAAVLARAGRAHARRPGGRRGGKPAALAVGAKSSRV